MADNNYWSNLNKKVSESGLSPSEAQTAGLTKAYGMMGAKTAYPTDLQAPTKSQYYANTAYQPYPKLTGGDYEKLQSSLQQPILTQSKEAQANIGDIYSGRNLYGSEGSGLMSGALSRSQQATQDALAKTVADRYGLQMQEAQNIFSAQKAIADQANQYAAGRLAWESGQDEALRSFLNQQTLGKYQANLGQQATDFERALGLAGQGSSGAGFQAQLDAAKRASEAEETGALLGALGTLGGGLMSSYDKTGSKGWNFGKLFG